VAEARPSEQPAAADHIADGAMQTAATLPALVGATVTCAIRPFATSRGR
jgi:hypothetical protein